MEQVNIYCMTTAKGARQQKARFGFVLELIREGREPVTLTKFGETEGTPNRVELECVLKALSRMTKPSRIHIYTESWYVSNGIQDLDKWRADGWKNKKGQPIANIEQWQTLNRIRFEHDEFLVHIAEPNEYRNWLMSELHRYNA